MRNMIEEQNAEAVAELLLQGVKKMMKIFTNYIYPIICLVLLIGAIVICITGKPYVYTL